MRAGVRRRGLRTKIVAWSLIPTSIILFTVAMVNFYAYQSVTEELVFGRDRDLTQLAAGQLALQLSQETDLLALVRAEKILGQDSVTLRLLYNLASGVASLRVGENGSAYLVDGNGQVIYHSDPRLIGMDVSDQVPVQRALKGEAGTVRTHDLEGQEIVASFARVPGTPWAFVNQESWAEVSRASLGYNRFLLALLALGLVAPVLVVTVGARWITRPIAQFVDAARGISRGNFEQRISVSTGDELEEMALQFNNMATKLQELYANLEHRVAERTKELETLNAIATGVNESLDLDETLNRALDRTLSLLGLEIGEIALWQGEGQLVARARRGLSPDSPCLGNQLTMAEVPAGRMALPDEPSIGCDGPFPPGAADHPTDLRVVAVLPLRARERVLGTLSLATPGGQRLLTLEEQRLLRAVSDQLGLAVENARLSEESRQRAVVEERNRLARGLHDSVTQALYGVTLYAEAATRLLAAGELSVARKYLREVQDTARESLREMRLLIFELRPPVLQQEGLVAALQARLEAVEGRGGLEVEFCVEGEDRLASEIEEGLYRIAQEALNNTLRHARAQHIRVNLSQKPDRVLLEIADDGIGFDLADAREHGGLGLCGMEERAAQLGGQLTLVSAPGEGTRVCVEVCPCRVKSAS